MSRRCLRKNANSVSLAKSRKRKSGCLLTPSAWRGRLGLTAMQAVVALQGGEVAIAPKPPLIAEGALGFGPACLKDGEAAIVAAEVCKLVQAAAAKAGVEVAATAEE